MSFRFKASVVKGLDVGVDEGLAVLQNVNLVGMCAVGLPLQ